MSISESTLREVEAVSRANREYEESMERVWLANRVCADFVATSAIAAHFSGAPLREAITDAVLVLLEGVQSDDR